jgi:hypothetical protein
MYAGLVFHGVNVCRHETSISSMAHAKLTRWLAVCDSSARRAPPSRRQPCEVVPAGELHGTPSLSSGTSLPALDNAKTAHPRALS